MNSFQRLQDRLQFQFKDETFLKLALSHRSYGSRNNERLEFLGDAVLGLVITDHLYSRFPDIREGDLSYMRSQIVRAESLAQVAKKLQLGADILLGQGEMKTGGHRRESILGDTVEALIGAVYLDGGIECAKSRVLVWFKDLLANISSSKPAKDAKTALQELLQQRGKQVPQYKIVNIQGEAHSRLFTVSCKIDQLEEEYSAMATSRRKAEQMVAGQLLLVLEKTH